MVNFIHYVPDKDMRVSRARKLGFGIAEFQTVRCDLPQFKEATGNDVEASVVLFGDNFMRSNYL